jgi:hypothetical protein
MHGPDLPVEPERAGPRDRDVAFLSADEGNRAGEEEAVE